ncbi:SusC/RagA family TonB-linked outer membrane protein [Pedobacter nyackensis]|uniref:TonB-linked outer membrane protein, SusC/RagA family n=1 Tax=Pedobacter nyackensis TaxID=475255 RepID=A0A1W2F259_9SPHI|nr:TonB-dependent receptor [Pedobacter nyackensis]SMD16047.1 TonB-linked outer membrane protein, SusC/RagA family [Pedobacter nyackensis]
MKKQLLLSNSPFLNFLNAFNQKRVFLCASVLILSSSVNAASEKFVKETKVKHIAVNSIFSPKVVLIKGIVKGEGGAALSGVTVTVKDSKIGTRTNASGEFQINAPEGATLIFSYLGYISQNISVGSKTVINVTMLIDEGKYQMNEVVVVGYGTQKRSDITGSVTSVPKERLAGLPVTNVLSAIEGTTAGLNVSTTSSVPGSSPTVLVRGVNSINAATGPLTVIDGVPFSNLGGSMNDINPNDIASIEILKDASAVAIYGTRGSSGVILITTKRGKTGEPTIRYSVYGGPEYQIKNLHPLSGPEYVEKYLEFSRQSNRTPNNPPVPNQYEIANYNAGTTVDWLKEISQSGSIQDHNLSISGGTEKIKYFVSGAYQKQKGVLKGFQFSRASVRSNLDATVTSWLTAGTSLFFANSNADGGQVSYSSALQMSPYGRIREENGDYTIYPMFGETLFRNPLLGLNQDVNNRDKNLNGTFYAEVKPAFIKGLKYRFNGNYTFQPTKDDSYAGPNAGNTLGGTAIQKKTDTEGWLLEHILSYNKDWNDHHLDVTALYGAQEKEYTELSVKGSTFVNDDLSFNNMGAAGTIEAPSLYSREAMVSQMGRLNYSYKSKYLITATVRRDGFSAFGAGTSKYGTFPSIALGWNISNERFLKNVSQIDNIKLRASYGTSGNQAINAYQTLTTQGLTKYIYNGVTTVGLVSSSLNANGILGNVNLNWESTTGTNLAVDFSLFKSRITGTVEVYKTETKDVLLRRKLPAIIGYPTIFDNLGRVANRGIEFTLNTVNLQHDNFSWSTNFNFSASRNKILSLYGDNLDDIGNKWFIGKSLYAIYDYTLEGVWQTGEDPLNVDPTAKPGDLKFADLNGDKKITEADKSYLGNSLPKWTGGMINNFKYKNFGLSVFVQTSQGSLINNPLLNLQAYGGRVNIPRELSYWTPENKNNESPSLTYTNPRLYAFPAKQDYLRIKDITLSYNLSTKAAEQLKLGSLSVFASGRNLHTFTNWIGTDPELSVNGVERQAGPANAPLAYGVYPLVTSVVVGLNITLR